MFRALCKDHEEKMYWCLSIVTKTTKRVIFMISSQILDQFYHQLFSVNIRVSLCFSTAHSPCRQVPSSEIVGRVTDTGKHIGIHD